MMDNVFSSTEPDNNFASENTFRASSTNSITSETSYVGDPETFLSCSTDSLNYQPSTNRTRSRPSRVRERELSYPSLSLYHSPSSSSRFRKTHYLDDSDEEIIQEEVLEVTNFNRYPTLMERWGDDTKTKTWQEGDLKIEEVVEFEEVEPTVTEEIIYELTYVGENLLSCRPISRSRSESRNFRKIRKKRIKLSSALPCTSVKVGNISFTYRSPSIAPLIKTDCVNPLLVIPT
ncbi:unnamed protein product [Rotaria sp. Silwood1]|nr:unnamed protein product [Rotaria sp. Silwood1]CAF1317356.1 unnamed protein product [Rotaria sp. Silwood1]CAF1320416.1 unnamed protein product [Rotaria sp. Silwood1]CAF3486700.1 unnamed protein product [Rotaria sp. Silwood1]CAF3535137.1 unnamed protein product [Rotaria sp. Silwood1]